MFIFVFFLSNYKFRLISCSDLNMCFIVIYRNEYFSFVNLSNVHVCSLFLLYIYTGIVYVYFTDIRNSNYICMPASKMILNSVCVCAKNLPAPPLPPPSALRRIFPTLSPYGLRSRDTRIPNQILTNLF